MNGADRHDIIILGAGAAGLMCAIEAGKRGRRVLVLENAEAPGEKIRISGGGRCNFTNIHSGPGNFLSGNPHFCKSPLSRYTPHDFISMVGRHGITWHEKTLGQLFCDGKSQQIIDMLLKECAEAGVTVRLNAGVTAAARKDSGYAVTAGDDLQHIYEGAKLVIATGGPSIPKMGASDFAYRVARQCGLKVVTPRAALVPLTFTDDILNLTKELSGVAVDPVVVSHGSTRFREALLFTHRGLSGPAILQISSYWQPGEAIAIDLAPDADILALLKAARKDNAKQLVHTVLSAHLPARLAEKIAERAGLNEARIADCSDGKLKIVADAVKNWEVKPNGSEGWRTAEVTLGGVDTDELSPKTFEAVRAPGLYFIGEAVDVTGHLGGHNFQWAWSSGYCCGQAV